MKRKEIHFGSAKEMLEWMKAHPLKNVYDEYGNYLIWGPYSNIVEDWRFLGDSEDEDGNFIPGDWDFDKLTEEKFLEFYEGSDLSEYVAYENIEE